MWALAVGLAVGVLSGLVYLFSKEPAVRRTLASSVLLGVVVGVLVELARRPLFTAVFAGVATVFVSEFIRWVASSRRKEEAWHVDCPARRGRVGGGAGPHPRP